MEWKYTEDKRSVVLPNGKPTRTKKITGTRLAAILGLNPYVSPFQAWCEITGVAKVPFEDNMYTLAGKAIEPKLIDYCKDYFFPNDRDRVVSPEEFYGNTYDSMRFDFYKDNKRFGGMWDSKILRLDHKTTSGIIEIKTTKKVEEWKDNPPVQYILQAMLYAYLENVNTVYLVGSFLEPQDYSRPEMFIPNEHNTIIEPMSLIGFRLNINGESLTMNEIIERANEWYDKYVETGISPEFDEKKDKDVLQILRKTKPQNDCTVTDMVMMLDDLEFQLDMLKKENGLDQLEKQIKLLKDGLKVSLIEMMNDDDESIEYKNYKVSKREKISVDNDMLKIDGIYDKYTKVTMEYRLTKMRTKN